MTGRRPPSFVPSVKPSRGLIVALNGRPGLWQITDQAPGRGQWWLVAADAAARQAPPTGYGAGYAKATAQEMTRSTLTP